MNGSRYAVYGALSLLAAGQASTLLIENTTTRAVVQLVAALFFFTLGVLTPSPLKSKEQAKDSLPPPEAKP